MMVRLQGLPIRFDRQLAAVPMRTLGADWAGIVAVVVLQVAAQLAAVAVVAVPESRDPTN
jgi:hypothetical protein